MKETYVFDSNFFISLEQSQYPKVFSMIKESALEGDAQLMITNFIIDEIKTLRNFDEINEMFDNDEVTQEDIDEFKKSVKTKNLPQDPDLSLVVFSKILSDKGKKVIVVSDDYKLHELVNSENFSFRVISPSVFLLTMFHKTKNKDLKQLYKKVRNYEMNYMIERHHIYPVEMKLSWLIDNLVLSAEKSRIKEILVEREAKEMASKDILRYLHGERVRPSKLTPFKSVLPFVEILKDSEKIRDEAKDLAQNGEVRTALQKVRTYLSQVKEELQTDSAEVGHDDEIKLRYVYSFELSKLHLLSALLNLSLGDHHAVEERLDDVAFMSLISRNFEGIVTAYVYRGMLELVEKDYEHAERFFRLASRLSKRYDLNHYYIKSLIGLSITKFLKGEKEKAMDEMAHVTEKIVFHEKEMAPVLLDFGNQLFYFGLVPFAYSVYVEALECSIEGKLEHVKKEVKEKIVQCVSKLCDSLPDREEGVAKLISHSNYIRDDSDKEVFEKEFSEIIKSND